MNDTFGISGADGNRSIPTERGHGSDWVRRYGGWVGERALKGRFNRSWMRRMCGNKAIALMKTAPPNLLESLTHSVRLRLLRSRGQLAPKRVGRQTEMLFDFSRGILKCLAQRVSVMGDMGFWVAPSGLFDFAGGVPRALPSLYFNELDRFAVWATLGRPFGAGDGRNAQ